MQFDDILMRIGAFGPYQRRVYFVMALVAIPAALQSFSGVFLFADTDYWCAAPEVARYNCSSQFSISGRENGQIDCLASKKNLGIPREENKDTGETRFAQCKRYNLTGVNLDDRANVLRNLSQPLLVVGETGEDGAIYKDAGGAASNTSLEEEESLPIIPCDAGWEYDKSQYTSTVTNEFDLVCENARYAKYLQVTDFSGWMVGSFGMGILADWKGRKPTFFMSLSVCVLVGIAQTFSPTLAVYIILRFIFAVFQMGIYMMAFVIGTEFVGPSYRAFAGQFIAIYFGVGYMLLAPIAYFVREWKTLQVILTACYVPFVLLIGFVPESVRWQLSRGRRDDARKSLEKMAKVNKTKLPENLFDDDLDEEKKKVEAVRKYSYLDLFRFPNLRWKTFNILFSWFVSNMVYYGISLSTSDLGVDHYIAAFVSGAVEIPAYIAAILVMQYIGRRVPLFAFLVVSGIACVVATFFEKGTGRAAFAMFGKFCIAAAFGMVYTYSAELYPTPVRSMGMGLSSMMARISGILCPFILDLSYIWFSLPYTIFGAFAITSGLLILLLPETRGRPLPDTLEAAERTGQGRFRVWLGMRKLGTKHDAYDISVVGQPMKQIEATPEDAKNNHEKE